jgi:hypothetical protein
MSKPQLLSGARGKIMVGTKILAYATDISINYPVNVRAVHTFGAINARSVEPLQAGPVQITIGRVIPVNTADGTVVDSSSIQDGVEPIITQMLIADDVTVTLMDKVTGMTVSSIHNCRFAGRSLNLPASQIATERIQMMGIYDSGSNGANTPTKLGV